MEGFSTENHIAVSWKFQGDRVSFKTEISSRPNGIRTPENIREVRQDVTTSPLHSAIKHALALGIYEWSIMRILHTHLKLHSYKMTIVQVLGEHDWLNCQASCKAILKRFQQTLMCSVVTKLIFICWAASTNKIFDFGAQTFLDNSMSDLSTVSMLLFGVGLWNLE
jgi:hypothetical protein